MRHQFVFGIKWFETPTAVLKTKRERKKTEESISSFHPFVLTPADLNYEIKIRRRIRRRKTFLQ